jgi:hypothetical protein
MRRREIWSVPVTSGPASADFTFGAAELLLAHESLLASGAVPPFDGKRFLLVKRPPAERVLVYVPHWDVEIRAKTAK